MKSIFDSKVFWLAVIQGIIGVVVVVGTTNPDLGYIFVVKSFLDIVLRLLTTEPVSV